MGIWPTKFHAKPCNPDSLVTREAVICVVDYTGVMLICLPFEFDLYVSTMFHVVVTVFLFVSGILPAIIISLAKTTDNIRELRSKESLLCKSNTILSFEKVTFAFMQTPFINAKRRNKSRTPFDL